MNRKNLLGVVLLCGVCLFSCSNEGSQESRTVEDVVNSLVDVLNGEIMKLEEQDDRIDLYIKINDSVDSEGEYELIKTHLRHTAIQLDQVVSHDKEYCVITIVDGNDKIHTVLIEQRENKLSFMSAYQDSWEGNNETYDEGTGEILYVY